MAIPVSSLSIAVQGIANFLTGQFGEDVVITIDTPQRASERVKSGDKHFLNLFTYRVMPSGFQAAAGADEPYFIRINVLLTPFLSEQDSAVGDADLRILGHAIRLLHSRPVLPGVLPGASAGGGDFRDDPHLNYRLEAVLQTPAMEELNHIWTTQGGELAYRLSAVYEFALIPVEPLEHRVEAPPPTTSIIDVQPGVQPGQTGGFIPYGDDASAIPVKGIGPGNPPPPTDWLPVVLLVVDSALSNTASVAGGTATIDVALAGPPGERVALEISWIRNGGGTESQPPQVFTINTPRIDDPAAINSLALDSAATGDSATILTRPVDAADQPIAASPFANTLALNVGAAA